MCFRHPANPRIKKGETMPRRKKVINNSDLPDHVIEEIARCVLPDIIAYYESEEGQQEFQKWKAEQELKTDDNDAA